jgi:hypothetical protein
MLNIVERPERLHKFNSRKLWYGHSPEAVQFSQRLSSSLVHNSYNTLLLCSWFDPHLSGDLGSEIYKG